MPAVAVLSWVGVENVLDTAHRMGINTLLNDLAESRTADADALRRRLDQAPLRLTTTLHHATERLKRAPKALAVFAPVELRIFEADEHDGRPFLAMELLAGRTLKQALRERGPFAVRRAVEVAADIAEALDYAHVKGVVHRDLKPENVMVLPDGSIKVMDFGIARLEGQEGLTSSQYFLGTPLYAVCPFARKKHGLTRTIWAIMLMMFVSGLWHGAGWGYILWGVIQYPA